MPITRQTNPRADKWDQTSHTTQKKIEILGIALNSTPPTAIEGESDSSPASQIQPRQFNPWYGGFGPGGLGIGGGYPNFGGGGGGGNSNNPLCPGGYFCVSVDDRRICGEGYYCPPGKDSLQSIDTGSTQREERIMNSDRQKKKR